MVSLELISFLISGDFSHCAINNCFIILANGDPKLGFFEPVVMPKFSSDCKYDVKVKDGVVIVYESVKEFRTKTVGWFRKRQVQERVWVDKPVQKLPLEPYVRTAMWVPK